MTRSLLGECLATEPCRVAIPTPFERRPFAKLPNLALNTLYHLGRP